MAMNVFSTFQNSKIRFTFLASAIFLLTATTTQAGFEWVPAGPKQPEPPAAVETVPMSSDSLLMHDEQPLSPLPGEEMLAPMPNLAPVEAMPIQPPAQQQPVIRVQKMGETAPASAGEPQPLKPAETAMDMAPPVMAEPAPMPAPVMEQPIINTRVIMPQDAPSSARDTMPQSEVLSINPYPQGQAAAMPESQADAPMMPAPAMAEPAPILENTANTDVVGFGSEIPLALALQQIAPPGYAFSFGEDINPGSKVSWAGGKGWVDVMHEMIAPLGLSADVRGKAIFIHNEQHSYNAPIATPAPMPAPVEVTAPEAIAPASGSEASEVEGAVIHRNAIQDPGTQPQQQPEETISFIESSAPVAEPQNPPSGATAWEAEKGDSLKQTLSNWSKTGAFALEWNAPHDYTLSSNVLVAGQLDMALKSLLTNGVDPSNAPNITFVKAMNGDAVNRLVIEDRPS